MMIDYTQLNGTGLEFRSRVAEKIPLCGHSVTRVREPRERLEERAGGEAKQNTSVRQGLERLFTASAGLAVPSVVSVRDSAVRRVQKKKKRGFDGSTVLATPRVMDEWCS